MQAPGEAAGWRYRRDIDGLRAVAVVPVVLYHAGLTALPGGFVGVDVFFVISGFVIAGLIRDEAARGVFSLGRFYERRARRILPALCAVLLATLAAGLALMGPARLEALAESALAAMFFVSNLHFERALDYFAEAAALQPLLHTWTLAIEEQFYLVFPLAMLLGARLGRRAPVWLVGTATALSLVANLVAVERWPELAFYSSLTRGWELGVGCLLALMPLPHPPAWARQAMAGLGIAAIAVAVFGFGGAMAYPGWAALLPVIGAGLVIAAGASGGSAVGALLATPPMVAIGKLSYSLYLWHWPVLAFTRLERGVALDWREAGVALAIAVVAAIASYLLIEQPFRQRRVPGRPALAAGAAAFAVLGLASAGLVASHGAAARYGPVVERIAAEREVRERLRARCFERAPEEDPCRLGAAGVAPSFMLWGDSHALSLFAGLDALAAARGKAGIFVGRPGCHPLIGMSRTDNRGCLDMAEAVARFLAGPGHGIGEVVLAARWSSAETGNLMPQPEQAVRYRDTLAPEETGPPREMFARGIRRTVETLTGLGLSVVVIGNVPEFPWNPAQRIEAMHVRGARLPEAPTLEAVRTRSGAADALLVALAAEFGAQFIRLDAALCAPACLFQQDGVPLYWDLTHLSSSGSLFVAERVIGPALWPEP